MLGLACLAGGLECWLIGVVVHLILGVQLGPLADVGLHDRAGLNCVRNKLNKIYTFDPKHY